MFFIIAKTIWLESCLTIVGTGLRPDKKGDAHIVQHTVGQREIIRGICCGGLNRDHVLMNGDRRKVCVIDEK